MLSRQISLCSVCGDDAVGINFGVPTCAPCKAFFRRNAVKLGKTDFVCQEDGDCPVTYQSRRICSCCRLAKCFRVGMQRSLILSDAEREARKVLVQQNRLKRAQGTVVRSTSSLNASPLFALTNIKTKYLSLSDQNLLVNIFNAYERTCNVSRACPAPYFPPVEHASVHTLFNDYCDRHKSLVEYFKTIPEFSRLSMDDKIRLVRNHFGTMLNINESILSGAISPSLAASIRNIFEDNLASDLLRAIELINTYAHDPVLLKLVLIVRSLCSSINRHRNDTDMKRIYDDTRTIFTGQNVYVELLWRYILSRSSSDRDAVKFFNKLILDLLFLQRACFKAGSYIYHLESEIDQMDPLMQSMWPRPDRPDECDAMAVPLTSHP